MRHDRFAQILSCMHFEKDMHPPTIITDKLWKLRPLTDRIKANMLKHFHPEQHLSLDESMIAFLGRHGCEPLIRRKPIRIGYKIWLLCTPSGYVVNFEIRQSKGTVRKEEYDRIGKCAA